MLGGSVGPARCGGTHDGVTLSKQPDAGAGAGTPAAATPASAGRALAPLLAGYWGFGQYWGVWVVVFSDFLHSHLLSEGEGGVLAGGVLAPRDPPKR